MKTEKSELDEFLEWDACEDLDFKELLKEEDESNKDSRDKRNRDRL